jgi:hypothetical protein
MRWFWQRRKRAETKPTLVISSPSGVLAAASSVERARTSSGRLGQPRQLTSELLVLARDYLLAVGARVRVEDEDVLSATLVNGTFVRYTSTLAKARADETMTLLVEGSEALASILSDIGDHARLSALRLEPAADPVALAMAHVAVPAAKCGRCLQAPSVPGEHAQALCAVCPLREDQLVLRWRTPGSLTARLVRQEVVTSVELAYQVTARDWQGRRDEWLRRAIDTASGATLPALSDVSLSAARTATPPVAVAQTLAMARAQVERALVGPLLATGAFLRQRALDEYRQRQHEVATTFDRLQRESSESSESARAVKAARARELATLAEVYAVDVDARMESACFITSPVALVALRAAKSTGDVLMRVDLGRQYVYPLQCASCELDVQAGYVCATGHVSCPTCAAACPKCGAWSCVACGEVTGASCAKCGAAVPELSQSAHESASSGGTFTVRELEALPEEMWSLAVEWLLTWRGIAFDGRRNVGELTIWHGHAESSGSTRVVVAALHAARRWALDEIAVRQTAAHLAPDQPETTRMILTTLLASDTARTTARQLGVELLDRAALEEQLTRIASAYEDERERHQEDLRARAEAASDVRQLMLDALDAIGRELAPLRRTRRSNPQQQVGAAAIREIVVVRAAFERVALAWETLLGDWAGSFGERPARDGSLAIDGGVEDFSIMAERATHLQPILLDAAKLLVKTPVGGEPGYAAFRLAVLEEWTAHCEAWRWRVRSYDPGEWQDYARAWNAKAAARAAEAGTSAGHTTARADKAQSQATRAG